MKIDQRGAILLQSYHQPISPMKLKFLIPLVLPLIALLTCCMPKDKVVGKAEERAEYRDGFEIVDALRLSQLIEYGAAKSKQTEKECFLGFRIGMTKKEVSEHLQKLRKEGKIKTGREGLPTYTLLTESGKRVPTEIVPSYRLNGRLSHVMYVVESTSNPEDYAHLLYRNLFMQSDKAETFGLYMCKGLTTGVYLGLGDYRFEKGLFDEDYFAIKDNLVIVFGRGIMMYYDAPSYFAEVEKEAARRKDAIKALKHKANEAAKEF